MTPLYLGANMPDLFKALFKYAALAYLTVLLMLLGLVAFVNLLFSAF